MILNSSGWIPLSSFVFLLFPIVDWSHFIVQIYNNMLYWRVSIFFGGFESWEAKSFLKGLRLLVMLFCLVAAELRKQLIWFALSANMHYCYWWICEIVLLLSTVLTNSKGELLLWLQHLIRRRSSWPAASLKPTWWFIRLLLNNFFFLSYCLVVLVLWWCFV